MKKLVWREKKIISVFKKIDPVLSNLAKFILVKDRPGHDLRYCLNSSKIRNKLKWNCKINFDHGIEKTILWYKDKFENNYFRDKNFKNRIGLKI